MGFRGYRNRIILLFTTLFIFGFLAMYIGITSPHWKVSVWLSIPVLISIYALIKIFDKSRQDLHDFMLEIKHGDLTKKFRNSKQPDELREVFEQIMEVIRKLRYEKELNHQYLQTIVEHINIALVCFDKEGQIIFSNKTFKSLINRSQVKNIGVLPKLKPEIYRVCKHLKSDQKTLIKNEKDGVLQSLSVQATEFKMEDHLYKLISLQNINTELEKQEMESWKKLVRVLTHEIRNTAIPISTLSNVINEMFVDDKGQAIPVSSLNATQQDHLVQSLNTIEKRSKGMVNFVSATKHYTNLPKPKYEQISANELLRSVLALFKPEFEQNSIHLEIGYLNNDQDITIDQSLIEQVLINILRNAIEALVNIEKPSITISLNKVDLGIQYAIKDNGKGMNDEELEHIFVPFYTTKKEGSGIGLSLSKQIIQLHRGSIHIRSEEHKGSTVSFTI